MEISISIPKFCLLEFLSFSFQSLVWAEGCTKKCLCETKETKDKTAIELWTPPNPPQTNLLFWIFKERSLSTWQTRVVPKKLLQPVASGHTEKSFYTARDSINYIYCHFSFQPEAVQTRAKWTVTKLCRFYTVGLLRIIWRWEWTWSKCNERLIVWRVSNWLMGRVSTWCLMVWKEDKNAVSAIWKRFCRPKCSQLCNLQSLGN